MRDLDVHELILISGGKKQSKPPAEGPPSQAEMEKLEWYSRASNGMLYTSREACLDDYSAGYREVGTEFGALLLGSIGAAVCSATVVGTAACGIGGGIAGGILGNAASRLGDDRYAEGHCPP